MNETVGMIGSQPVSHTVALLLAAALAAILAVRIVGWVRAARKTDAVSPEVTAQLTEFAKLQSEMQGHIRGMATGISERLDGLGHRLGQSMTETTKQTQSSLSKLNERLAVIDSAQQN